jgi:hypothetical protein
LKELVAALSEWRKIGAGLSLVLAIMTGLIIFLPDQIINRAGITIVKAQILPYIGVLFFASIAVFSALSLESIFGASKSWFKMFLADRRWRASLNDLTPDEKEFLRQYIDGQQASVSAPLYHGVASALSAKKIIIRTSSLSNHAESFPYALQPWARRALVRNPNLLAD